MPEDDIAVYSLPEDVAEGISKKAANIAMTELAKVQKRIKS
jgi:hypothetical protein